MSDPHDSVRSSYHSLMLRLLRAGLITRYDEFNEEYGQLKVEWNPKYHAPLGGETAFHGLASLLQDLSPDGPLTAEEQALLLLLHQSSSTPPSN